jgi:CRP-like cAMP-binding protein
MEALERLSDLGSMPDLGTWFTALLREMSDGNPPLHRFAASEPILRIGEPADDFLVVLAGTAAVLGASDDERSLSVGPGALLGELGILFSGRRRRTVVASTPVVAVAGTRAELERALQVESVGSHVASVVARRLAEAVEPLRVTTAKGLRILLRPLLPADRALYLEAFGTLSLDALRTRFFAARKPPDAVIERLIAIDYIDHVAWVALDPDHPSTPLGISRLVVSAEDPRSAEFAVLVFEPSQGRGLATQLVGTLGVVAEAKGLSTVFGHVLADNHPMRAVCGKAHASWSRHDAGVLTARMAAADVAALLDADTAGRISAAARELEHAARLADA